MYRQLLLLFCIALPLTSSLPPIRQSVGIMAKGAAESKDSSVLRELKETIKQQKEEIERLKKELKPSAAGASHQAHGHGGGEAPTEEELSAYMSQPFYRVAMSRVGWLSLFLLSLSFTAIIMNGFEHTLEKQIELSYFVPLLAGHGGNTGGQSVGTVLSAISSGRVKLKDAPPVIMKEALSGIMMGTILGIMVAPTIHFVMGISRHVSVVIFFTLPLVSTIAALLGATIPFASIALGLDPSVIAGPAMTSFVDVAGLMSYFLIAQQVFKAFGIEL